jgi:heptosyltransferase-2
LTLEQNRGVYEGSGLYDFAIYLRLTTIWDFTRELIKLFFTVRSFNFNLIINLEPLVYFGELISFYAGVGDRVGFVVPGRRTLFTKQIEFREDEHIARTFYRALSVFGIEDDPHEEDLQPEPIPVTEDERAAAAELLRKEGVTDGDFIVGVNVNASDVAAERRWSLENFAALVDDMIAELGAKVLLFGAPDEATYVQKGMAMMKETPISVAGKTSLREAIALMQRLHLFVTNDSGPLHLAYAVGTPTISLFGPESPERYGPFGKQHKAIFKNLDCSPCISFKKLKKTNCDRDALCMREITTEEVVAYVRQAYRQWKDSGRVQKFD